MSSRKSETDGMIVALAFVGVIIAIMLIVIYAVLVFAALVITLWAIAAWNRPVTLFDVTLEPPDARTYVMRGVIGAVLAPLFVIFCDALFGFAVPETYWVHTILGGYAAGSLGIEILSAREQEKAQAEIEFLPPLMNVTPPTPVIPTRREAGEPFDYASWDDEEQRA